MIGKREMKKTFYLSKFIIISIIIILYPAKSQFSGDQRIYSLADCIKHAKMHNSEVILARAQAEAASSYVTRAFGNYLPTISFNMGYSRMLNPDGGRTVNVGGQIITIGKQEPNSYSMGAYATMDIFDGFGREAYYNQSKLNYESTISYAKYVQSYIELKTINEFIDVIRYQQILKVRQENITLAKAQLERNQALYKAGIIPISNVLTLEAELSSYELDLIRAETDMNIAKATLLSTMGLQPDLSIQFIDNTIPEVISDNEIISFRRKIGSTGSAIKTALDNREDYQRAMIEISKANAGISFAQSGYYPRISAQGGWSWSNNFFQDFEQYGRYFIGLNLSIPIFENFNANLNIQNAKLRLTQAEMELKRLEQDIRRDVQIAYYNLESSEKQIEASKRYLKSSEENYNALKERYNVGAATMTEVLQAANQYINARINSINSAYAYIKAQKNILFILGLL